MGGSGWPWRSSPTRPSRRLPNERPVRSRVPFSSSTNESAMKYLLTSLTACLAIVATSALAQELAPPPPPAPDAPANADNVEVLARGPLHEAFAQPVTFNPEPGPVVTKAPPAPIEELPAEQKPAGDNV